VNTKILKIFSDLETFDTFSYSYLLSKKLRKFCEYAPWTSGVHGEFEVLFQAGPENVIYE